MNGRNKEMFLRVLNFISCVPLDGNRKDLEGEKNLQKFLNVAAKEIAKTSEELKEYEIMIKEAIWGED
jgi:hypothetical protein